MKITVLIGLLLSFLAFSASPALAGGCKTTDQSSCSPEMVEPIIAPKNFYKFYKAQFDRTNITCVLENEFANADKYRAAFSRAQRRLNKRLKRAGLPKSPSIEGFSSHLFLTRGGRYLDTSCSVG